MKVLAAVVAYKRLELLDKWLRAWAGVVNPTGADSFRLLVVHNQGPLAEHIVRNLVLGTTPTAEYRQGSNHGMDIGALRDTLRETNYDVLYWSTDDALPMSPEFLKPFVGRFTDPSVGLVGNYLLPFGTYQSIPEHVRTVSFAIRRSAAVRLRFPSNLSSKVACWDFEYGKFNMHKQVQAMGLRSVPADKEAWPEGDKPWYLCNDYVWDCGEIHAGVTWDWRRNQDHWARFEAQFSRHYPITNAGGRLVPYS